MACKSEGGPSLAELARTALARARLATLTCRVGRPPAGGTSTIVMVRDEPDGRPLVEVDRDSPLVRQLAVRPVATLTVAAPAPFAALHLSGPAMLTDPTRAALRAYRLSLLSMRFVGGSTTPVPLGEYHRARPDPLWRLAPDMLYHLEHAHADDLLACIRAHGVPQVEAVLPRAIDRYGIGLALITDVGVGAARLPFPGGPVATLAQVGAGLRAVLTCRCGGSLPLSSDD